MSWVERLLQISFFRFAVIGAGGFVVDESVLTVLLWSGQNKFFARVISIFVGMAFTWLGNRVLTFKAHAATGFTPMLKEAGRFFAANSVGAVISYSVYAGLVRFADAPLSDPNLAVVFGVLVSMTWNFLLSKHFVFGAGQA